MTTTGSIERFAWRASLALATTALLVSAGLAQAGAPAPDFESETAPVEVEGDAAPPAPAPGAPEIRETPVMSNVRPPPTRDAGPPRPLLDPSARLLAGDQASEAWVLFVELESGHRITQRFLLTNVGPGEHTAVALGHLVEPGRAPYRYQNGRRRARWTLSDDRLFMDISASHLDLHRPKGELRITKDDIEIRMFFDFAESAPSARIPASRLPADYRVEVLAMGAATTGSIRAPWMTERVETRGRTWLVHSWTPHAEAQQLRRRVDVFAHDGERAYYALELRSRGDWESAFTVEARDDGHIVESPINVQNRWFDQGSRGERDYPLPESFAVAQGQRSGEISLDREWLRFDPLDVIPQPFRWFIRRGSRPREVWADARIGGSLFFAPESPSLPHSGETTNRRTVTEASRAVSVHRESEDETASSSVTGVASITFLNPMSRR